MVGSTFRNVVLPIGLTCVLFFYAAAWGHDMVPPWWRGQSGTTFQLWDFLSKPPVGQPVPADRVDNPYGSPFAIAASPNWEPGYAPHVGQIQIRPGLGLTFMIPNLPVGNPLKLIWVQATYLRDPCNPAVLEVRTEPTGTLLSRDNMWLPDCWKHEWWELELRPNPLQEHVFVLSALNAAWVDQVIIDTWCTEEPVIPEWSAFALAAPAVLGLLGLRRRRS